MDTATQIQDALESSGDHPPVNYDRAPTFAGMVAEKDIAVPMRDGVNLSIDVYRPNASGRFPTLLAFSITIKICRDRIWQKLRRHNPPGFSFGRASSKRATSSSSSRGVTST